jgi:hypothetical protein
MSLNRFVYYSAVVGGWAACFASIIAEFALFRRESLGGIVEAMLTAALVGAALGAGLHAVSGMTNAQWTKQAKRLVWGAIGGGIGGTVGGLLGSALYGLLGMPRAFGWLLMGLGIGVAEGVYERSARKIRNGLIGGGLGGLLGGILFDPIAAAGSDTPSRVTAFVILGLSVGAMIGLAHVVFKEAWVTVVDGYRPGRQLILTSSVTYLGRGDHLALPFVGYSGRDLESEHAKIVRRSDGQYVCEDTGTRIGTKVNHQAIRSPVLLQDGDLIRLGPNIIRFSHRQRDASREDVPIHGVGQAPFSSGMRTPPPPGTIPSSLPGGPGRDSPASPPPLPRGDSSNQQRSAPRIPPPPPPPS